MVYIHSEIYPYVVITIGLENILIIVKAVMSTPEELDVSHIRHTIVALCMYEQLVKDRPPSVLCAQERH